MYEKNGEKYFVVDSHMHFWDASRDNWVEGREKYAKGWIDCFYGYHRLAPPKTLWSGTSTSRSPRTTCGSSRRATSTRPSSSPRI